MKASILGPTNMKKFSNIIGKSVNEIENIAKNIGKILADNKIQLVTMFNYSGMLKVICDVYKEKGGKLEILYTENDYDWDTDIYMDNLKEADIKTKKDSWHDLLLSLVKEVDIVICAGLSAGGLTELGYMKWNFQENKGNAKALIGIKELLRNGELPPEISYDLGNVVSVVSIKELDKTLKKVL